MRSVSLHLAAPPRAVAPRDGTLTRDELDSFASTMLKLHLNEAELNRIFKYFDEDGSNVVTIDEFIDGCMAHTARSQSSSTGRSGVTAVATGRPMGTVRSTARSAASSALSRAGSAATNTGRSSNASTSSVSSIISMRARSEILKAAKAATSRR
jgi:hypothetical protein